MGRSGEGKDRAAWQHLVLLAAFTVLCVTSARYLIEPLEGSGRNAVVMREVVSTAWQSSEFNDVFKWT